MTKYARYALTLIGMAAVDLHMAGLAAAAITIMFIEVFND